ncbi:hypothetical protein Cabys_1586 [Caldithrix abyssi DSM 13497]|uniref:Uncharacterized protein n=2 Tax=Caldithrix abyssi TaxID=187145 RepID=A0A1J1C6R5_CALAY|nr:hypothetical protein Cabys_1586 [Caldithrix abyssi DSM 13497]
MTGRRPFNHFTIQPINNSSITAAKFLHAKVLALLKKVI